MKFVLCKMIKYNFICFYKVDFWCLLFGWVNNRGRVLVSWEICVYYYEI